MQLLWHRDIPLFRTWSCHWLLHTSPQSLSCSKCPNVPPWLVLFFIVLSDPVLSPCCVTVTMCPLSGAGWPVGPTGLAARLCQASVLLRHNGTPAPGGDPGSVYRECHYAFSVYPLSVYPPSVYPLLASSPVVQVHQRYLLKFNVRQKYKNAMQNNFLLDLTIFIRYKKYCVKMK